MAGKAEAGDIGERMDRLHLRERLAGHLLEICRGSRLAAELSFSSIPIIGEALDWVKQGVATGASTRNWAGYGHEVEFSGEEWQRKVLTDPQTSGGLLVSCDPASLDEVLAIFRRHGFDAAARIGQVADAGAGALLQVR